MWLLCAVLVARPAFSQLFALPGAGPPRPQAFAARPHDSVVSVPQSWSAHAQAGQPSGFSWRPGAALRGSARPTPAQPERRPEAEGLAGRGFAGFAARVLGLYGGALGVLALLGAAQRRPRPSNTLAALAVAASEIDPGTEEPADLPESDAGSEAAEPPERAESIAYSSTRARKLRELVLVQEIRSDLTEAEFALRLSEISKQMPGAGGEGQDLETEAASINLPRLYERLSTGIDALSAGGFGFAGQSSDEIDAFVKRIEDVQYGLGKVATECSLPGGGGIDACETLETRDMELAETVRKRVKKLRTSITRNFAQRPPVPGESEELASPQDKADSPSDPTAVFIRKDGTVDWDAAMESGREVARFGNDLWDRVNGVDQEGMVSAEKQRQEFLKDPASQRMLEEIRAIGTEITQAEKILRENKKRQATDVEPAALSDLRLRKLILETDLSMELVFLYIEKEIGQVTVSDDMKYLIAEFGLLDSQVQQIVNTMKSGKEIVQLEVYVIAADVQQLVKRLGLLELAPFQVSWTVVNLQLQQTVGKFQSGCAFVVRGIKMLGSDCWYTLSLVGQAIKGTVLTPREVRCVRRNLKDLLTLIPYTIILAIPLSPVGHVLVFNILQRLFPGFCPSTFTERRQNLATLYDAVRIPDEPDDGWFARKPAVKPAVSAPGGREIPQFRFTEKKAPKPFFNFSETQTNNGTLGDKK